MPGIKSDWNQDDDANQRDQKFSFHLNAARLSYAFCKVFFFMFTNDAIINMMQNNVMCSVRSVRLKRKVTEVRA